MDAETLRVLEDADRALSDVMGHEEARALMVPLLVIAFVLALVYVAQRRTWIARAGRRGAYALPLMMRVTDCRMRSTVPPIRRGEVIGTGIFGEVTISEVYRTEAEARRDGFRVDAHAGDVHILGMWNGRVWVFAAVEGQNGS